MTLLSLNKIELKIFIKFGAMRVNVKSFRTSYKIDSPRKWAQCEIVAKATYLEHIAPNNADSNIQVMGARLIPKGRSRPYHWCTSANEKVIIPATSHNDIRTNRVFTNPEGVKEVVRWYFLGNYNSLRFIQPNKIEVQPARLECHVHIGL
jgi:hypothetical protein